MEIIGEALLESFGEWGEMAFDALATVIPAALSIFSIVVIIRTVVEVVSRIVDLNKPINIGYDEKGNWDRF